MEHLGRKIVKIRKSHTCFGCLRKFNIGSIMESATFVKDNIYTLYHCKTCYDLEKILREDIYDEGTIYEGWLKEYIDYDINLDEFRRSICKANPDAYLNWLKNEYKNAQI